MYKCTQIRVRYTHNIEYLASRHVGDIQEAERTENKQIESQIRAAVKFVFYLNTTNLKSTLYGTPLLVNIKGCGYPPSVNCDEYAEEYANHSKVSSKVCTSTS